jgi:hypothetical protein
MNQVKTISIPQDKIIPALLSVASGIPEGAKVQGIRFANGVLSLVIEDASFPKVPFGNPVPELPIEMK